MASPEFTTRPQMPASRIWLFLLRAATLLVLALLLVLLGLLVVVPMHVKPPLFPFLMLGLAYGIIWAGVRSNPPGPAGVAMAVGVGSLMALFIGLGVLADLLRLLFASARPTALNVQNVHYAGLIALTQVVLLVGALAARLRLRSRTSTLWLWVPRVASLASAGLCLVPLSREVTQLWEGSLPSSSPLPLIAAMLVYLTVFWRLLLVRGLSADAKATLGLTLGMGIVVFGWSLSIVVENSRDWMGTPAHYYSPVFLGLWPIMLAFAVYAALGLRVLFAMGRSAVDRYDVIKGVAGAVLLAGLFFTFYLFPFLRI